MQTTTAPTLRAYDITVICLGVRYHWYGLYATDWDAIDAMLDDARLMRDIHFSAYRYRDLWLATMERGVEERDALGKLDVRHVSITYVPRRRSSSEVASFRGVVRLTTSFADGAGAT